MSHVKDLCMKMLCITVACVPACMRACVCASACVCIFENNLCCNYPVPAGVVQASDDTNGTYEIRSECRGEEVAGNFTSRTPWGREFKVRWCVFTHGGFDKIYFEVCAHVNLSEWIGIGWSDTPSMVCVRYRY